MKRTIMIVLALLICSALAFTGCKKAEESNFSPSPGYVSDYDSYLNEKESFAGATYAPSSPDGSDSNSAADPFVGRKVIRNASLTIEALEFEKFIDSVTAKVNALGGYIQSNDIRSNYRYNDLRYAEMTVRVPAEKLDEFLAAVNGLGNVTAKSENVDDITDTYVDLEARLSSLRTEYDTLLELLSRATSLDEIITLQDRLSDVRYQIEAYEARQRSYDSQIAFSTVRMDISEVLRETPVDKESFGSEVSRRFSESLGEVGDNLRAFAVWFLGDLPSILCTLIILGLIALVIILIVRASKKRRAARRAKAEELRAKQAQELAARRAQEGEK